MRPKHWRIALMAALGFASVAHAEPTPANPAKPTIILVHGAFAGSSSWSGVTAKLEGDGYKVIAAANPLRSLTGDAAYVAALARSVPGPVLLVGHSYGGAVISEAGSDAGNVKGLVMVAGFTLDTGESASTVSSRFPGSTLGATLSAPVALPDGGKDLYIAPDKYWKQFAADVPQADAVIMAATQRPVTEAALSDPARSPAWKSLPVWFISGSLDRNIPAAAQAFMAKRANAREAIMVEGASHVVMVSHPAEVAAMIERAATAP
jgi:pimeloyl-ACP methyl ester carboxylesterase